MLAQRPGRSIRGPTVDTLRYFLIVTTAMQAAMIFSALLSSHTDSALPQC